MLAVAVTVAFPAASVLTVRLEGNAPRATGGGAEADGGVGDRVAICVGDQDSQRLRERRADRGGLRRTALDQDLYEGVPGVLVRLKLAVAARPVTEAITL